MMDVGSASPKNRSDPDLRSSIPCTLYANNVYSLSIENLILIYL